MSSLFVNNIKHTNTQDAISIDTSGNVALNQVGTGTFYRTGTLTPVITCSTATNPDATVHTGTPTFQHGHMSELVTLFLFSGFTEILLVLVIQIMFLLVMVFVLLDYHLLSLFGKLLSTRHIGSFVLGKTGLLVTLPMDMV